MTKPMFELAGSANLRARFGRKPEEESFLFTIQIRTIITKIWDIPTRYFICFWVAQNTQRPLGPISPLGSHLTDVISCAVRTGRPGT